MIRVFQINCNMRPVDRRLIIETPGEVQLTRDEAWELIERLTFHIEDLFHDVEQVVA